MTKPRSNSAFATREFSIQDQSSLSSSKMNAYSSSVNTEQASICKFRAGRKRFTAQNPSDNIYGQARIQFNTSQWFLFIRKNHHMRRCEGTCPQPSSLYTIFDLTDDSLWRGTTFEPTCPRWITVNCRWFTDYKNWIDKTRTKMSRAWITKMQQTCSCICLRQKRQTKDRRK